MSSHPTDFQGSVVDALREAIERQLPDSPQVLSTRKLLMQSKRDDVVTTYGGALAGLPSAKKSPAPAAP